MRVLIVCPVFPPEPVTSATTTADLACELTARGHSVTVITSCPSRPGGRAYAGYRRGFARRERAAEGYAIVRTWSVLSPRGSAIERLLENLSFGVCAMLQVLLRPADVVFQNNWPIFAAGLVALAARIRRAPVVSSIQDIHPEAALQAGKLRVFGPAVRWLQWLDGRVARASSAVVVPCRSFARVYRDHRGVPADRVRVAPNWMDETAIAPGPREGAFRARLGVGADAFVGLYAGNIGEVADVETLVEAAALLRDEPWFALVIVGDGSHRAACEELAAARGVKRIRFHCPWREESAAEVHAAADALLLPTRGTGALTSTPSKLIAYLLSGRPVVAGVDPGSDVAQIVAAADCGQIVPPGSPAAFADAIRRLRADPALARAYGERAREYARKRYARGPGVARLAAIVEAAGSGRALPDDPDVADTALRAAAGAVG